MENEDEDASDGAQTPPSPLRIVGPDDTPEVKPAEEFPVHEATTRKVQFPQLYSGTARASPRFSMPWSAARRNKRKLKVLAVAAAAAIGVGASVVVFWKVANKPVDNLSPTTTVPTPVISPMKTEPVPASRHTATPTPRKPSAPDISHIQIRVRQTKATLTLDEGAVEGNRLEADVAKDQKIHVLSASAPGYISVKKIVSFAKDVYLEIDLKKAPPSPRGMAKRHPTQPAAKAKADPRSDSPPKQVEEYGMTLERPTIRRPPNKKMDEKDPYAP
jgi:hypothetical protein